MNYQIEQPMDLMQKLAILADAAKYDVACTSSGVDRSNDGTRHLLLREMLHTLQKSLPLCHPPFKIPSAQESYTV